MRINHSLLAVYGAIDETISNEDADDPIAAEEAVERFLPGTTGLGQRGWYREIQHLVESLPRQPSDPPLTFPDLNTAIGNLADSPVGVPSTDHTLSTRDSASLLYAAAVLNQIKVADAPRISPEQLSTVHKLVAPEAPPRGAADQLNRLISQVNERSAWAPAMAEAQRRSLVSDQAATITAPCTGSLRKVSGEYCTVLTTEFDDETLLVEQMKAVIDPLNWDKTNSFFRTMTPRPTNDQGWSRVVEEVGTEFRLKTALKYWKAELTDGSIFINYDLDDDRSGDDGLVLIDNGYIMVRPLTPGRPDLRGVRVYTSKEVRVQGLSSTATTVLACVLGWADVGKDMLFDSAKNPPEGLVGWSVSKPGAPPLPTKPVDIIAPKLTLPGSIRAEWIETIANSANDYIDRVADGLEDFEQRWEQGITENDAVEIGHRAGLDIVEFLRKVFDEATSSVRPAAGRRNS